MAQENNEKYFLEAISKCKRKWWSCIWNMLYRGCNCTGQLAPHNTQRGLWLCILSASVNAAANLQNKNKLNKFGESIGRYQIPKYYETVLAFCSFLILIVLLFLTVELLCPGKTPAVCGKPPMLASAPTECSAGKSPEPVYHHDLLLQTGMPGYFHACYLFKISRIPFMLLS